MPQQLTVKVFLFSALGVFASVLLFQGLSIVFAQTDPGKKTAPKVINAEDFDSSTKEHAGQLLQEGKQAFRFDTFGSEEFWGDKLKVHDAIQGSKHGGVSKPNFFDQNS